MGWGAQGLGFGAYGVLGFGLRVWGWGLRCLVWGCGLGVYILYKTFRALAKSQDFCEETFLATNSFFRANLDMFSKTCLSTNRTPFTKPNRKFLQNIKTFC